MFSVSVQEGPFDWDCLQVWLEGGRRPKAHTTQSACHGHGVDQLILLQHLQIVVVNGGSTRSCHFWVDTHITGLEVHEHITKILQAWRTRGSLKLSWLHWILNRGNLLIAWLIDWLIGISLLGILSISINYLVNTTLFQLLQQCAQNFTTNHILIIQYRKTSFVKWNLFFCMHSKQVQIFFRVYVA